MNLIIDTKNKTITVTSQVNMGNLIDTLNELFPTWKDYMLDVDSKVNDFTFKDPYDNHPGTATYTYHLTGCNCK